jgi:hypothetical protein
VAEEGRGGGATVDPKKDLEGASPCQDCARAIAPLRKALRSVERFWAWVGSSISTYARG